MIFSRIIHQDSKFLSKKSGLCGILLTGLFCTFQQSTAKEGRDEQYIVEMQELLKMDLSELFNVEVYSPGRKAEKLSNSAAIIRVIKEEDLHRLGAKTLSEVLWTVAGVQVQNLTNGRHSAWFRGVQTEFTNKTALFIDGVPFRDPHGGFKLDEEIPLENIKRIEIIRGPGSALYGSNAFSSVISIFTYDAGEKKNNQVLKVEAGNHDTTGMYFRLEEQLAFADIQVQGKYFSTDGAAPKYDREGNLNNTDTPSQDLRHIQFKASALDKRLKLNLRFNRFSSENVDKGLNRSSPRDFNNYTLSLRYRESFNENLKGDFHAYYNRAERYEDDTKFAADGGGKILESFSFDNRVSLLGFSTMLEYIFSPRHTLTAGLDYQRDSLLEDVYTNKVEGGVGSYVENPAYQNLELNNIGLFLQDSFALRPEKTFVTLGMRYDILDLFNNQFSYRIGLVNHFSSSLFAKLLFGTAYRAPSFLEYTRADSRLSLPDVENMKTLELQLVYKQKAYSAELSLFRNHYDNFIRRLQRNSILNNNTQIYLEADKENFANTNDQVIYGAELETRIRFQENLQGFANIAWLHGEDADTSEQIPLLADWTAAFGLDWNIPAKEGMWSLHNHWVWYGDRLDWPADIWDEGQPRRHAGRTDDFSDGFLVGYVGLRYLGRGGIWKNWEFALNISNILNKEYFTQSSALPEADSKVRFDNQYEQRSIHFSAAYRW